MRWSIPIVVVALSACILAGSLGFQDTVKETTQYDSVLSDLSGIAEAGPVTDTVNYNPLTNVTGWVGNVGFDTQSVASLYMYQTDLTWDSGTTSSMTSSGVYLLAPTPYGEAYLWYWNDNATIVGASPPGEVIGGWNGTFTHNISPIIVQTIDSNVFGTIGSTEYDYVRTAKSFNIPNNTIIKPADAINGGVLAVMNGSPGAWVFTFDSGNTYIKEKANMDLGQYTALDFDVYYRDGLFYRINSYEENGAPNIDEGRTYIISLLSNTQNAAFNYKTLASSTTSYIKPYTPAYLPTGPDTATWRNGYSNTTVQFLAEARNLSFSINGDDLPELPMVDSQDSAYVTWMNGYTGLILITLNADGTSYWQGVTSYANTKDFTVAEYKYPLQDPPTVDAPIESITFQYTGPGTHRVAIVDTWVPQDSNGLLWGDATFNIDTVFPTLWSNDNLRVKFNSFVVTGSGVTINGVTYPVEDGNITIDEDTFKLAGSSLEFADGDTTLMAPNGDTYDLGASSGQIVLNGTWYGIMSLDTFETVEEPATEAVYGIVPEINWLAWVFVGVLVIGAVGVMATGRQLDSMDMLALFLMGIAGVTVAVI